MRQVEIPASFVYMKKSLKSYCFQGFFWRRCRDLNSGAGLSRPTAFRVISNQLNFSEVSGTCGNLKEVKTLVISRFFSSKKPQTPLYTTIFYIHINYIDFAHFWELIGNSLGKTFITYY